MGTAGMAVTEDILQKDLRFLNVLLIPSGAHLQGVELGPEKALGGAFLFVVHGVLCIPSLIDYLMLTYYNFLKGLTTVNWVTAAQKPRDKEFSSSCGFCTCFIKEVF